MIYYDCTIDCSDSFAAGTHATFVELQAARCIQSVIFQYIIILLGSCIDCHAVIINSNWFIEIKMQSANNRIVKEFSIQFRWKRRIPSQYSNHWSKAKNAWNRWIDAHSANDVEFIFKYARYTLLEWRSACSWKET